MGNSRRHNRLNCDTVLFHSVCFSHFIAVVSICRGRILIHFIKSGAHKMWCALFTYSSLVSLICFSVCVDFFSRTGMGASWCLFSCLKKKKHIAEHVVGRLIILPFIIYMRHIPYLSSFTRPMCSFKIFEKTRRKNAAAKSFYLFFLIFSLVVCMFVFMKEPYKPWNSP